MICTIFTRLACKSKCNRIHFKALHWLGTIMSTDKSLKHLKSKDKFLIANVSNYSEKHSGRDSSSYIQQTIQATGVSRRFVFRVRKELRETGTLSSPDNTNLWTTLTRLLSGTRCRSFTPISISFRP